MIHSVQAVHGNGQMLDGGALFGTTPKTLWSQWLEADDQNRLPLACRCLILESSHGNILIEASIGAFLPPKLQSRYGVESSDHLLLQNLEQLGYSPESIDYVILSHLHFDHAGGILSQYQEGQTGFELVFPNAQYICGDQSFERTLNPHPRDKAMFNQEIAQLLQDSGRLHLVKTQGVGSIETPIPAPAPLTDDLWFHMSHGHTPGMILPYFKINDETHCFPADLIPGNAWIHQPITMGYDRFAELVVEEKTAFLKMALEQKTKLHFYHDAHYASGDLVFDGRKYAGEALIEG